MTIFYNDNPIELPNDYMNLEDFAGWKEIPSQGTAIAVNNRLISRDKWPVTKLANLDRITVITAAFGG